MKIMQERVYVVCFEDVYEVMLRDGKASSIPSIEFYVKRKSDANWLLTFGLLYEDDHTEIIGAKQIDFNNQEHIQRLVDYFADEIRRVEIPLYNTFIEELDKIE